jgi:hypothetical protein
MDFLEEFGGYNPLIAVIAFFGGESAWSAVRGVWACFAAPADTASR